MAEAKRRLAAILSADVAGYSRLMGADDRATLAALKTVRATMARHIEAHDGRVVNAPGDALLAEFASAVEAVDAAGDIQAELAAHNADLDADRRMLVRIGVNLGDVLVEPDGTLYGDGVNIAARVESLAAPGGICVSGKVVEEIEGKCDLVFADIGEHEVKNIARPVQVWRWPADGSEAAEPVGEPTEPPALPDRPSIAVLPFENLSGDPEQAYFADGVADDIITGLSQIAGLFVIARNSSFSYRGKAAKVQDIARELGVRCVLEGSVRKSGGRVRITAQLVDGATEGHLWADKFDRELTDIFAVQDEVTHEIVSALGPRLTDSEATRLETHGTNSVEAYDYLLRGRETLLLHTPEANTQARNLFERAAELDASYAAAYAYLAETRLQEWQLRMTDDPAQSLELALDLAEKAVALDPELPHAHGVLGQVYLWQKQHDRALVAAERRVALDPNDAEGCATLSMAYYFSGQPAAAAEFAQKAMRLNPHYPFWYVFALGMAHYLMGDYRQALHAFERSLIRNPNSHPIHLSLASCYAYLGEPEKAEAAIAEAQRLVPGLTVSGVAGHVPFKRPEDLDHYLDGMRKAGLPED